MEIFRLTSATSFDPLECLRDATRTAHRSLEESEWLVAATASLTVYGRHIGRVAAFHIRAAAAMRAHADDLRVCGLADSGNSVERLAMECERLLRHGIPVGVPAARFAELPTASHAVGARYVLGGASLGGLVIARTVRDRLHWESSFYGAAGSATATQWRQFCALLRASAPALDPVALVEGAHATFAAFDAAIAQPLLAGRARRS